MFLRYLYTISKLLCFDIEFRVLRYRFFFRSSLGCLLGTGRRLRCAHCIANQVAHAPPGPPSAAAAEAALGGAATPAAPGAAPAAAAGAAARLCRRSGCRSLRSGHQRNAGARDSWRQELTGAKFAAAGVAAGAAGAGINGTHERVILGNKN
jgi:hypothetical protein